MRDRRLATAEGIDPALAIAGIIGAVGACLAAGYVIGRLSRKHDDSRPGVAARREGEGSIRSAGPDGMRSETRREWTRVDEASDESFPASDPPATY